MDLTYFKNRSGMVAVSYDGGDTIIIPSGKTMDHNVFWEDVADDLRSELTPEQEGPLQRAIARYDSSPMGDIIRTYGRNRKLAERLDGIEPEPVYRKLPDSVRVIVSDLKG